MELSTKSTNFNNLNKFKQFLLNNNIELFDHEIRIVYKRLSNISSVYEEQFNSNTVSNLNLQNGGSINISQKLKKMSQQHILHLISSLMTKNDIKINWILNLY